MPYGRFTYSVEKTRIVSPSEYSVIKPVGYDRLVLTACHPLYSAAQRIVVFARQVGVQARGAARVARRPETPAKRGVRSHGRVQMGRRPDRGRDRADTFRAEDVGARAR